MSDPRSRVLAALDRWESASSNRNKNCYEAAAALAIGLVSCEIAAAMEPQPSEKAFRLRGWFGICVLVPAGIATLLSPPPIGRDTVLDFGTNSLAWILFFLGATLRVWSTLYVGGRKTREVVTEGPYSMTRNPLYLGSFLLALSFGVFLKSLTFVVALMLVMVLYASYIIPTEERLLLEMHGDAYKAYCARTPRIWPKFSAYHTSRSISVDVGAIHREARKSIGWLVMPLIGDVLAHLRFLSWWPSFLHLP